MRVDEQTCPFCDGLLGAAVATPAPSKRLGRAALFVFAAGMAGGLSAPACAKKSPSDSSTVQNEQPPMSVASYGGPSPPAACDDAGATGD